MAGMKKGGKQWREQWLAVEATVGSRSERWEAGEATVGSGRGNGVKRERQRCKAGEATVQSGRGNGAKRERQRCEAGEATVGNEEREKRESMAESMPFKPPISWKLGNDVQVPFMISTKA